MKFCPKCDRFYEDEMMNYCLEDGTVLEAGIDTMATLIAPFSVHQSAIQTVAFTSQNFPKYQPSIVVMPFANVSAQADNEYFCDGLTEELLNGLAKIENVKVVARTSAFSLKNKNISVNEIGQLLNVNSILEGSVRRAGNRVRITVQLVNAADGFQLWSEKYDRKIKDIFHIQDEITLAVTDALKVKLFGESERVFGIESDCLLEKFDRRFLPFGSAFAALKNSLQKQFVSLRVFRVTL